MTRREAFCAYHEILLIVTALHWRYMTLASNVRWNSKLNADAPRVYEPSGE